ncbi:MAG: RNA methyltransferase [Candidatus Anstonellaceae archaeon]
MKLKIIFIEPEYEINIGMNARLLKNFAITQMHIVNPKCSLGFSAKMYAKHAKNIIENARIYKKLEDAIKDCELIIGTTGRIEKNFSVGIKPLDIKQIKQKLENRKIEGNVALLFGPEGIGLKEDEIKKCDLLLTIPTSKNYPVMNITNALAICLYEFKKIKPNYRAEKLATKNEREYIKKLILKKIENTEKIKNKEKIKNVLFSIVERKFLTEIEARALLYLLK